MDVVNRPWRAVLTAPWRRWQRARIRLVMRGYRSLQQSGGLERIATLKQALTVQPLSLQGRDFSNTVIGSGAESGEAVIRQYLLIRVGGLNFNRALLAALGRKEGRIIFPLPREWREIVEQHGFRVAPFRSTLLWLLYLASIYGYGLLQMVRIFAAGGPSWSDRQAEGRPYVAFADLGSGNLPRSVAGGRSHDVVSWYLQWPGRVAGIETVHHTVAGAEPVTVDNIEVLPARRLLPDLTGWRARAGYLWWALRAATVAAFDLLRGRWWHALILSQAALAAQVRFLEPMVLAREYLFHNSGWIYRPLWTYEAEARGARITFYFYSTNCESFRRVDGLAPMPSYGWQAMTWPRYLVWDEYQADFVQRMVGAQANISIVGSIWFQSSAAVMPQLDRPAVGVFDVTPHRASRYCMLGLDREYYTPAVVNPFMGQVSDVVSRHGLAMVWKQKRNIGRLAHPLYRHLADRLSKKNHVVLVAPDISAIRVIEACVAVVSMPFTSTAHIAREMGKPSVYYDPSGLVPRDDRAAHGIPILRGEEELDAWLSAVVST